MKSFLEVLPKIKLIIKGHNFSFTILILLSFINVFVEMISIGLIIPLIDLIMNINGQGSTILNFSIFLSFDEYDQHIILLYFSFFIILVFFLKSCFLIFFNYFQSNLMFKVNYSLAHRLLHLYLSQDYIFFIKKKSSELIRNLTSEVSGTISIINAYINLFVEVIIILGIFFVLLFFQTLTTLFISFVLIIFFYVYFFFFQKKISNWGKVRQKSEKETYDIIQQGVGGIIEIILLNCKKYFLNIFNTFNKQNLLTARNMNILAVLPRSLLEFLSIILVSSIIIINIIFLDIENLLPSLAIFAVAFFRFFPSINKIINIYQTIKFSRPSIILIFSEINTLSNKPIEISENKINETNFQKIIELKDVSFNYNEKSKIFENINIKINKNSFIGIYGESGSGKTTFINLLLGLIAPVNGKINVDGKDINTNIISWRNNISYVSQNYFIAPGSILQNIAFGLKHEEIDFVKINYALKNSELTNFVENLPEGLNTLLEEGGINFSGGQRQRIAIARCLYFDKNIIVMDEATNSLDKITENKILKNIKRLQKKTIILVTHNSKLKKYCDNIYLLKNLNMKEESILNEDK